jgi:hypothetical protein
MCVCVCVWDVDGDWNSDHLGFRVSVPPNSRRGDWGVRVRVRVPGTGSISSASPFAPPPPPGLWPSLSTGLSP